jgi:hypothetical protein
MAPVRLIVPDKTGRIVRDEGSFRNPADLNLLRWQLNHNRERSEGLESVTLGTSNLPPYTPAGSVSVTSVGVTYPVRNFASSGATVVTDLSLGSNVAGSAGSLSSSSGSASGSFSGSAQGGTSVPIRTVAPTMVLNKILRII